MTRPERDGKRHAARAALAYLRDDMILGVGTGSTVNALIELLRRRAGAAACAVRYRAPRARRACAAAGIAVLDLNDVTSLAALHRRRG